MMRRQSPGKANSTAPAARSGSAGRHSSSATSRSSWPTNGRVRRASHGKPPPDTVEVRHHRAVGEPVSALDERTEANPVSDSRSYGATRSTGSTETSVAIESPGVLVTRRPGYGASPRSGAPDPPAGAGHYYRRTDRRRPPSPPPPVHRRRSGTPGQSPTTSHRFPSPSRFPNEAHHIAHRSQFGVEVLDEFLTGRVTEPHHSSSNR